MWDKLVDFCKSHKYVIFWTVGYFIAIWAIMKFMFNFNILSAHRWWQLAHSELHGFPGFVFGILILAAVPMYIATTVVIARTKAPLVTIKIPEFIKRAFQQTPMPPEPDTSTSVATVPVEQTSVPDTNANDPIPDSVPNEIRIAYARARKNGGYFQKSVFNSDDAAPKPNSQPAPEIEPTHTNEIPIPADFDIDDMDNEINAVPQFTDINFDDDDDDDIENTIANVQEISDTTPAVEKHLAAKSVPYTVVDQVVITDKFAIVSHSDSEFWVADNESWFAAGKTRPSPIELVKRVANEHNVRPVLYLGSNNIMDIEKLVPQWENDGIIVITDLKDLI